ncbi:MAG: DUF1592 domain-containing protein [Rubripirellula sp.]|nr:DUF1592 domain-containing protein [Rubripirellula sp.]
MIRVAIFAACVIFRCSLAASEVPDRLVNLVSTACISCHSSDDPIAELNLEQMIAEPLSSNLQRWEQVVKKVGTFQMPPADADRPRRDVLVSATQALSDALDSIANKHPRAGHVESFRRLTRYEYGNAIRDLLSLQVDANSLLPPDEVSHGFDNITVSELSPTLLNRYVSAAQKISRLAIGRPTRSPGGKTYRVPPDVTQDVHLPGLPLGTRGGILVHHLFPEDGEYEISIRLSRDRNEHVEGMREEHKLDLLLDRKLLKQFTVRPPAGKKQTSDSWDKPTHANIDRHLKFRFPVTAGTRELGVTFLRKSASLLESERQPLNVHYNMYRHPRLGPAVFQVSITGPYDSRGPGETPSRDQIFRCYPTSQADDETCAREIITNLLRRATRGPVSEADLANPLKLYREACSQNGFEAGIEMALAAILVHPRFLFRIEREPPSVASGEVYALSELELASRLSFFLWSSIPDDELLTIAQEGQLRNPLVLERQVRRMLADPRAESLVKNFVSQWLYLKNLDSITPDGRFYPDFDDNLRQAFRQETELFVGDIFREDRPVIELLKSDATYLNERLAKHYDIPHVYGSRFRRVQLDPRDQRGGLLRQGSILTVTSYANRTSPVLRGKWILENLLGIPPPPPPPDIPDLVDNFVSAELSVRQRLAQHRADPTCASCHNLIDPIGFSLENYDAVGRWRLTEKGQPVDANGGLPGGREFTGVEGLENGLLEHPEIFVSTLAEKLLTYAVGRGTRYSDAPFVRQIVREAKQDNYRLSSIVLGIVRSPPFQKKDAK